MDNELPVSDGKIIDVLCRSIYPGAEREDCAMALAYCRAAGLDPMLKPVHLVPMYDKKTRSTRVVVMPGIGLYRIMAARTGEYAGVSEPEYGPTITAKLGGTEIAYPEWCKVTVKRALKNGIVASFTATEFWVENYAQAGQQADPNQMWRKRAFGQLAKCTEAQALRKAFPEVGSVPTSEEMEGKTLFDSAAESTAERVLDAYPDAKIESNIAAWSDGVRRGISAESIVAKIMTRHTLTEPQRERILSLGAEKPVAEATPEELPADAYAERQGEF